MEQRARRIGRLVHCAHNDVHEMQAVQTRPFGPKNRNRTPLERRRIRQAMRRRVIDRQARRLSRHVHQFRRQNSYGVRRAEMQERLRAERTTGTDAEQNDRGQKQR